MYLVRLRRSSTDKEQVWIIVGFDIRGSILQSVETVQSMNKERIAIISERS